MKFPRVVAAMAALPLLLACIGIILGMKKGCFLRVDQSSDDIFFNTTVKISFAVDIGNAQIEIVSQSWNILNFPIQPYETTITSFKSACPDINGRESCFNGGIAPIYPNPFIPRDQCVPSSAWALVIVNQLFASVAIVVQVPMIVALCIGKGNRVVHQVLNGIGAIALLISVVAIMMVPSRLYQVCASPILKQSVVEATLPGAGGKQLCAAPSFILTKSAIPQL
jgi:hypothetical protein